MGGGSCVGRGGVEKQKEEMNSNNPIILVFTFYDIKEDGPKALKSEIFTLSCPLLYENKICKAKAHGRSTMEWPVRSRIALPS